MSHIIKNMLFNMLSLDKATSSSSLTKEFLGSDTADEGRVVANEYCKDLSEVEKKILEWKTRYIDPSISRFDIRAVGQKSLDVEISLANEGSLCSFVGFFDTLKYYLDSELPCMPKGSVNVNVHLPKWPHGFSYAKYANDSIKKAFSPGYVVAHVKTTTEKDLSMKVDCNAMESESLRWNGVLFSEPVLIEREAEIGNADTGYQLLAKQVVEDGQKKLEDYQTVVIVERPHGYFSNGEAFIERGATRELGFRLGIYTRETRLNLIKDMHKLTKAMIRSVKDADQGLSGQLSAMEGRIVELWKSYDVVKMTEYPEAMDGAILAMDGEVRNAVIQVNKVEEAARKKDKKDKNVLEYNEIYPFPWNVLSLSIVSPKEEKPSIKKPCITVLLVPKSFKTDGRTFEEAKREEAWKIISNLYSIVKKDGFWQYILTKASTETKTVSNPDK